MQDQNLSTQTPDGVHTTGNGPARPSAPARPQQYVRPRAHIVEDGEAFVLQVELPGVARTGLEITFENGELFIVGHRTAFQTGAELIYRESRQADFRRVFEVDSSIDASKINAHLEQGVLTLTLPKAESSRPRRIEVNHVG